METVGIFCKNRGALFWNDILEEAKEFWAHLDRKLVTKVIYNIGLAEQTNDPKLFKKLKEDIWEFWARYAWKQIRLLAFWDKSDKQMTLVIATHGFLRRWTKFLLKKFIGLKTFGKNTLSKNLKNDHHDKGKNENIFPCRDERQICR